MNKICTSIEQSNKLIELGIDTSTADMHWEASYASFSEGIIEYCEKPSVGYDNVLFLPAWSLSALEGLMPFQIIKNNERFGFYQVKGFNKQGETYRFGYKTNNDSFLFETSWYNDVTDVAFEMVVWLKENGKI